MSQDNDLAQQILTERQKMEGGLAYNAMFDEGLLEGRLRARKFLKAYNDYPPATFQSGGGPSQYFGPDERIQHLADLFELPLERVRKDIFIEPPFYCDYGTNITFTGDTYMNFGTTVNCAKVTIGTRTLFGPGVHIYAATHSTDVLERRASLERAYPVTIGDDVWVGGHVTIIGPCNIGNGVSVGAGAVVKGDIPDNVVIGGNPARILKRLNTPPPFEAEKKEEEVKE
ncbi:hypothetical protein M422DRAFT_180966 [Sphaerobolus stellatus SS14]|uniref:Maltose/galactoside acetyltransferase domain-containing protein n=1 Tax=Sphaerobolus stellatus (strain SS14) TaxID=990650 RepID=A0A0C9VCZ4_SPHS4|nr:hypothetical protein M422DRAFT_180966 [Sphaerobolus stellatus SS14]